MLPLVIAPRRSGSDGGKQDGAERIHGSRRQEADDFDVVCGKVESGRAS